MKFWHYNKIKIARISGLCFIGSFVVLFIAAFNSGLGFGEIVLMILPMSLLLSVITMIVLIVKGITTFTPVNRLLQDDSERSLLPLFDDGYTITLKDGESKFAFTKERLRVSIAGLPATISFSKEVATKRPNLVFAFYPLSQPGTTDKALLSISFITGFRSRPIKDIKPEVLQFVEDLKAKGYTAAG